MAKRRRLSDSQVLYNAAMEPHPRLRNWLRELPKDLQRKFRTQLEGLQIPGRGKARKDFQTFFAALAGTQIALTFASTFYKPTNEELEADFSRIRRLTVLCGKSPKPVKYMKFLSMRGITDTDCFFESMGFFAKGRVVTFQKATEGGLEIDHEGKILHISKKFQFGGINVYLVDNTEDMEFGGFAEAFPHPTVVLGSESESILQHELQHIFDFLTNITLMFFLGKKSLESVDLEKENKIEKEMRAYLAQVTFAQDYPTTFVKMLDMINDLKAGLAFGDLEVDGLTVHDRALLWLEKKLDIKERDVDEPERIKNRAKAILNREYRKILGLTYDELLEPFQK